MKGLKPFIYNQKIKINFNPFLRTFEVNNNVILNLIQTNFLIQEKK